MILGGELGLRGRGYCGSLAVINKQAVLEDTTAPVNKSCAICTFTSKDSRVSIPGGSGIMVIIMCAKVHLCTKNDALSGMEGRPMAMAPSTGSACECPAGASGHSQMGSSSYIPWVSTWSQVSWGGSSPIGDWTLHSATEGVSSSNSHDSSSLAGVLAGTVPS